MKLCDYGCGQEAHFQLKNGKWCCCQQHNSCPKVKQKLKETKKKNEILKQIECPICKRLINFRNYSYHLSCCKNNHEKKDILTPEVNSKYLRIYNSIIEKREKESFEGYGEVHHILPRCLGGSNSKTNLVRLTAREHYICHMLLIKIYEHTQYYYKMLNAFIKMKQGKLRYTSKMYDYFRKKFSEERKKLLKEKGGTTKNKITITNIKTFQIKFIEKSDLDLYLQTKEWIRGKFTKELLEKQEREKQEREEKFLIKEKKKLEQEELIKEYFQVFQTCSRVEFIQFLSGKMSFAHCCRLFHQYFPDWIPKKKFK